MSSHTNFLLITSDQHNPFVAGFAGDPVVATPTLDRLAAEGMVFDAAYTNNPICMPARATLATGRYGSDVGSFDNGSPYAGAPIASWGHRLREQGRPAVTFGKLHFAPASDSGFDARLPLQAKAAYSGALLGWARGEAPATGILRAHALDAAPGEFEYTDYDRHTTASACRWLTTEAPADTPWAAHVSFAYPHYPFRAPSDLLPDDRLDIPLPPAWHPDDWPDNPEVNVRRRLMRLDEQPLGEDELRTLRWIYSGMVAFVDQQVAAVLDALDASGQRDRTVILYTSDHGDMLGGHGLLMKSVMYDGAARVPTVLNGPDVDAGSICSTAVSLADVFPTAVATTGCRLADEDGDLPGTSLVATAGSAPDPGRIAYSEYHGPLSMAASYLVRRGRWKYIHHAQPEAPSQLFDLESDPQELIDRIDDEASAPVRAQLEQDLRSIVDPEALDAMVRATQQERLAQAGGLDQLGGGAGGPIARTDRGVIAAGWTVPPPDIMAIVGDAAETPSTP